MMLYILICVSLALAAMSGMQFFYLAYLDKRNRDNKARVLELEKYCAGLHEQLLETQMQLLNSPEYAADYETDEIVLDEEEIWSEFISDEQPR